MEQQEIKTKLEEYRVKLTTVQPEDVSSVEVAKWRLEINQLLAEWNKEKYLMPITEFHAYNKLAQDLVLICVEMSKDGMLYFRTIRNVCKEKFSVDEWCEICAEVRRRLNK
ncbi:MAG: hypothetical protein R3Y19_04620 [Rikenellaceae bacterium]